MIRHLLLDLDDTLYPASSRMDEGITNRMIAFVATWLGTSVEEARRIREARPARYGTTLEWLREEHGMGDDAAFFAAVHPESELFELESDPRLRPYLQSLGVPISILTNSPSCHASRVIDFFGLGDVISGVYDLTWNKGVGKPHPSSFLDSLSAAGFSVAESLFVDDLPKYVRGYRALGGPAVLVDETGDNAELARAEGYPAIRSIYDLGGLLDRFAT